MAEHRQDHPALKTDDAIAEEALAQYSGKRGYQQLTAYVDGKKNADSILQKMNDALSRFWSKVCDFLHIHYTSKEQVADRILYDLINGVNPQDIVRMDEDIDQTEIRAFKDWFGDWQDAVNPYSSRVTIGSPVADYDTVDVGGAGCMYPILLDGERIGWIPTAEYFDFKNNDLDMSSVFDGFVNITSFGNNVEIRPEYRGNGYGKAAYFELARLMDAKGLTLRSAVDSSRSDSANHVWQSLERDGLAHKEGDRYVFDRGIFRNVSKVVDDEGRPLVVEHATDADFTVFDPSHIGENSKDDGLFGAGFYFGTHAPGWMQGSKNVMKVYLNIRNPFEVNDAVISDIYSEIVERMDTPAMRGLTITGLNGKQMQVGEYIDVIKAVDDLIRHNPVHVNGQITHDEELQSYHPKDRQRMWREHEISRLTGMGTLGMSWQVVISEQIGSVQFTEAAKKDGYDGVIVDRGEGYKEYVAFDPSQIKSATHNLGTYLSTEKDIRYHFIGEKGATNLDVALDGGMNMAFLKQAKILEGLGKDAEFIKLNTGWEKGADGKWRMEIPGFRKFDPYANVEWLQDHPEIQRYLDLNRKDIAEAMELGEPMLADERQELNALRERNDVKYLDMQTVHRNESRLRVSDYVDAPMLFMAYPELREMPVRLADIDARGSFCKNEDILTGESDPYIKVNERLAKLARGLNHADRRQMESVIAHEIQHYIQEEEDFARGVEHRSVHDGIKFYTDHDRYMDCCLALDDMEKRRFKIPYTLKKIEHAKETAVYCYQAANYSTLLAMLKSGEVTLDDVNEYADRYDITGRARDRYLRSAGEVEARNVQERLRMTIEERRHSLASSTEDVPREDQIVSFEVRNSRDVNSIRIFSDEETATIKMILKPYLYNQDMAFNRYEAMVSDLVDDAVIVNDDDLRAVITDISDKMSSQVLADTGRKVRTNDAGLVAETVIWRYDVMQRMRQQKEERRDINTPLYARAHQVGGQRIIFDDNDRDTRDMLIDKMRRAGIRVSTDASALQGAMDGRERLQSVWHGSRRNFDRFDHRYMGMGQGSQVFGYGTYVTTGREIGEFYADKDKKITSYVWASTGKELSGKELAAYMRIKPFAASSENKASALRLIDQEIAVCEYKLQKNYSAPSDNYYIVRSKENMQNLLSDLKAQKAFIEAFVPGTVRATDSRYLYQVSIPDDDFGSYLPWGESLTGEQRRILFDQISETPTFNRIVKEDFEKIRDDFDGTLEDYKEGRLSVLKNAHTGTVQFFYWNLSSNFGDQAASRMLSEAGYTGIKYPAGTVHGVDRNATNYVIFDAEDAKIEKQIRFFLTPNGEAYGFVKDDVVYIDRDIATSETPIHEYAHLWAEVLRQRNPQEWQSVVDKMKQDAELWNTVKEQYPHLESDDDIADEVLAQYSGRYGSEMLSVEFASRQMARQLEAAGLGDKAVMLPEPFDARRYWMTQEDRKYHHEYVSALGIIEPYTCYKAIGGRLFLFTNMDDAENNRVNRGTISSQLAPAAARAVHAAIRHDLREDVTQDKTVATKEYAGILGTFWGDTADFFQIHYNDRSEIADRILKDLLNEVNPLDYRLEDAERTADRITRYHYIGEKGALNIDNTIEGSHLMLNLEFAEEFEENGLSPQDILRETGWVRGVDNKWRYEIEDTKVVSLDLAHDGTSLGRVVESPLLFAAYPEMKDYTVAFGSLENGSYNPDTDRIILSERFADNVLYREDIQQKVLAIRRDINDMQSRITDGTATAADIKFLNEKIRELPVMEKLAVETRDLASVFPDLPRIVNHEIQHGIQKIEGFAFGGNLTTIAQQRHENAENIMGQYKEYYDHYNMLLDESCRGDRAHMLQYTRLAKDYEKQYKPQIEAYMAARMMRDAAYVDMVKGRLSEGNFDEYRRLAGEVEARNVENRMAVPYESRRFLAASVTEDVARESQIVRYSTGIAASIAGFEKHKPLVISDRHERDAVLAKETSRSDYNVHVGYSDVISSDVDGQPLAKAYERSLFYDGKPIATVHAIMDEDRQDYRETYVLNLFVGPYDNGEGWSPVAGKPLTPGYEDGAIAFDDEKEMVSFYEQNRQEIEYRKQRSRRLTAAYEQFGLQEAQMIARVMPVSRDGFVSPQLSWILIPWVDVNSDRSFILMHTPEERERLRIADGEMFGDWMRRNGLSSGDYDTKVWFYQKYASRWNELSRLFADMQFSSHTNREEAYITGRKVAEIVSDRKEGFAMIDLLKEINPVKIMPYLDGVADGFAEKEGRQVTAGSPLTVDEAREAWQKAWGDYVESGRQMQQSEDHYNSLLTQSILDRYKDVELNLSDEDNRLLDDLFEARKVFLADEDRDYDRFQDVISSDAPYYAIHGDVREAVSSIFWHEDPLTYRQRDLVLAALRREPGYLLEELKSSAWDLGYEDIVSCFMEAADYPTLLSQSEVDVIHRITRVSDIADMTDYEKDVYRDVMDAYNAVKEDKVVTVRQRDLLVAYGMSICPDSGTANMRYLAAEMGIDESVLGDALSHPVRDQKEEEHLEDTLSNHDVLLQRLADTVGVGHRYDFRNLDDMFDDRSLSLSAMPDRMTGIDFVEVRLDGSVFIAFHGYDEDGDLVLDGVSGEKLSRFDVGHLQEILGAVEMKQGRSIDVSDQLRKQEEIHNSRKEQKEKDMAAVYQQEESRKQSYAQKTEEALKAVLRPGMGLGVYAFEPVEFMKPSSLGDPVGQVVRRGDTFEYYVTPESAPMSLEVALAADSRHSIYKTAMLQRIADMLHEPGVDGRMDFDGSVTAGSVGDYVSHEIRHIDLISGNDTEDGKDLVRFWNDAQKVCDASNYCFSDDGYEALVAAMEAKLREVRGEQASVQEGTQPVYAAEDLRKRLDKILAKDGDFIEFPTGERILKSPDGDDYIIFEDVEESVHSSLGELSENIKAGGQQGTAAAAFVDGALDGIIDEKYELKHKFNVRGNAVQGMDGYSEEDILKVVEDYYDENAGYDANYEPRIVQMTVVGSRTRGEARDGSDLDVLVEYMDFGNSDTREESLFNALNDSENRLEIEGVKVDINPISPHFSRTTAEWLERDAQWRKEDQAKALDLPKGVLLGNDARLLESMRSNPKDSYSYKAAMDEYDHSFAEEYVEYNVSYARRLEGKTLEEVEQRLEALKAFYNDGGDLSDARRVIQAAIQATEDRAMQLREEKNESVREDNILRRRLDAMLKDLVPNDGDWIESYYDLEKGSVISGFIKNREGKLFFTPADEVTETPWESLANGSEPVETAYRTVLSRRLLEDIPMGKEIVFDNDYAHALPVRSNNQEMRIYSVAHTEDDRLIFKGGVIGHDDAPREMTSEDITWQSLDDLREGIGIRLSLMTAADKAAFTGKAVSPENADPKAATEEEMKVIRTWAAQTEQAVKGLAEGDNQLADTLRRLFVKDAEVPDWGRSYFMNIFEHLNTAGDKEFRKWWDEVEDLSGGNFRQFAWAVAYKLPDFQIEELMPGHGYANQYQRDDDRFNRLASSLSDQDLVYLGRLIGDRADGRHMTDWRPFDYFTFAREVTDAEAAVIDGKPLTVRQRDILIEEGSFYYDGLREVADDYLKMDYDRLVAALDAAVENKQNIENMPEITEKTKLISLLSDILPDDGDRKPLRLMPDISGRSDDGMGRDGEVYNLAGEFRVSVDGVNYPVDAIAGKTHIHELYRNALAVKLADVIGDSQGIRFAEGQTFPGEVNGMSEMIEVYHVSCDRNGALTFHGRLANDLGSSIEITAHDFTVEGLEQLVDKAAEIRNRELLDQKKALLEEKDEPL